jgi:hypothetical protein
MGTNISGGMIVGLHQSDIDWENVRDYLVQIEGYGDSAEDMDESDLSEEVGFDRMSPYYDAGFDDSIVGFDIKDTSCGGENLELWLVKLKQLIGRFKEITGETPQLIGMQNVT